jgi:Family of unknown function (DUF6090)
MTKQTMAKLFNKIRHQLVSEKPSTSRTANYLKYAIGEIVLVVLGILIALSINTWNEQRKMNLQEQEILEGFKTEFTTNFKQLEKVIKFQQKSDESANKIMTYFNKDVSDIPEAKFDSLQYFIFNGWTFDPRKGLLNSVIASGQINLISNVELKNQLASFEDMVNDLEEESQSIRLLNAKLASIQSEYINVGKQNAISYKVFVNEGFQSDYNRFFKDIRVYNIINNASSWRYDLLDEETKIMQSIKRILELIAEELEK